MLVEKPLKEACENRKLKGNMLELLFWMLLRILFLYFVSTVLSHIICAVLVLHADCRQKYVHSLHF